MSSRCLLVSNNVSYKGRVDEIDFVEGSSFDVLIGVRDYVHKGAEILTHPLCGNLRPYQQPYRSVVLRIFSDPHPVDEYSLSLIENALGIYRSCFERLARADSLPDFIASDYAFVESELMRSSLESLGLLRSGVTMIPKGGEPTND